MNKIDIFRKLVRESLAEVRQDKVESKKTQLKESLRPVIKRILSEISNVTTPEPTKDEKEKVQKGFAKDGNERVDKTNDGQLKEIQTIVHGINPDFEAYLDDHGQIAVRAQNLLYIRIVQKFENNYDVDAMPRLVDRVRAIGLTWEQVKAFVKANFGDLKKTKTDGLKQKAMDHKKDRDVVGKMAGPDTTIKNRGEKDNGEDAKLKTTARPDMNFKKDDVEKDEDQPDQPMKQVTEPGKDPKSLNKNIEKTSKVKPPKHDKSSTDLKAADKKTTKLRVKKG